MEGSTGLAALRTNGGSDRSSGEKSSGSRSRSKSSLEFTMRQYPCAKMKLDQFFLEWLSLPEYERLIATVLENAASGRPLRQGVEEAIRGGSGAGVCPSPTTPPISPKKFTTVTSKNPFEENPGKEISSEESPPTPAPPEPQPDPVIPQFYFPRGKPVPAEMQTSVQKKIDSLFRGYIKGMMLKEFMKVVKDVCELPRMVAHPLFEKLKGPDQVPATVRKEAFVNWWESKNMAMADKGTRLFEILRKDGSDTITQEDFGPLLRAIVDTHPSLEFLADHPEFQERYIETVGYRILYSLNKSRSGKISRRELKRSDLLSVLVELDGESDINRIHRYFSYEHFYVIYCKFWELDTDHDFYLDKEDLIRYGCHCLTYKIVERVFEEVPHRFFSRVPGKMCYKDFVWFVLSEEDKASDTSIEYWFRCIDLDCDGYLSAHDMKPFYEEQLQRMENSSCEPVLFEDVICQLHDLIQPQQEGVFCLKDLIRQRSSAGILFNTLFNLHKFLAYEHRDPFTVRAEQESNLSDWDRFAAQEYDILAAEEEQDGAMRDGADALAGALGDHF